jgi:hypothetical protein
MSLIASKPIIHKYREVHYDLAVKHAELNSYFVWVGKEKQEVKIAPIQKGTTNLYKLSEEFKKLIYSTNEK